MSITSAVILAGGKGTRLASVTGDLPKALAPIAGVPLLEHQIRLLVRYGVKEIHLLLGYKADVIQNEIGSGDKWNIKIHYHIEASPLGTGGCLSILKPHLTKPFFVLNGDIMLDMDFQALADFHLKQNALATLVVHPNDHPYDSDLIDLDSNGRVLAFHSKPHPSELYFHNLVNAGVFVLEPRLLQNIQAVFCDLGHDVLKPLIASEKIAGYNTPEYMKDMGTPERLESVTRDSEAGKIARLNKKNKRPAIFLDRDGVINEHIGLLHQLEQFKILPGVPEAIAKINHSDFLAIVVTNQPVIARGLLTEDELAGIHKKMEWELGKARAKVDAIYYCPHHQDKGFEGEIVAYKIDCNCRKPKPGMLLTAASTFGIDLDRSWIIGDREVDLMAGKAAGVKTICVGEQLKEKRTFGDYYAEDLPEAVDLIWRQVKLL